MEALDQLIINEERKIDHLMQIRNKPAAEREMEGVTNSFGKAEDIDYGIEKAYEQLAIYKIRKEMGF